MQDAERLAQEELLARLKRGDEQALVDLADEFGTKIYQLAFRYLRNKEDAEEVTQDVLFKVYRKVGAFRGDAALSSWIYRITFNAAMSRLRTAKDQRTQNGAMSRLRTAKYQRTTNDELSLTPKEGGDESPAHHEVADCSDLADERVFRSQ